MKALDGAGAQISRGDSESAGAPLGAAASEGYLATIAALLGCGISVDYQEESGELALMGACENRHLKVWNCLLEGVLHMARDQERNYFALYV